MNLIIAGGIKVMLKDCVTSAIINDPLSKRTLKVWPCTVHNLSRELYCCKRRGVLTFLHWHQEFLLGALIWVTSNRSHPWLLGETSADPMDGSEGIIIPGHFGLKRFDFVLVFRHCTPTPKVPPSLKQEVPIVHRKYREIEGRIQDQMFIPTYFPYQILPMSPPTPHQCQILPISVMVILQSPSKRPHS